MNSNYLNLENLDFEGITDKRVSSKILTDKNYKKELLKFIKTFDAGIENINTIPNSVEIFASGTSKLFDNMEEKQTESNYFNRLK